MDATRFGMPMISELLLKRSLLRFYCRKSSVRPISMNSNRDWILPVLIHKFRFGRCWKRRLEFCTQQKLRALPHG